MSSTATRRPIPGTDPAPTGFATLALDAWRITLRSRSLWWLGLVSAVQVLLYGGIVMTVTVPLAALPQLVVTSRPSPTPADAQLQALRERILSVVSQWLAVHGAALLVGIAFVIAVWVVLGVLDVASQSGLITQAAAADARRATSFRSGMRDGFHVWWRVVGLLAIAAVPGLFSMLLMGLVVLFTITVPLMQGLPPDPAATLMGNLVLSPVTSLAALIAIPLGVIVQLGLRDAVLADKDWRAAFRAGWELARVRPAEVAVVYLLMLAVGLGVTTASGFVLAVIAVPAIAVGVAVAGGSVATAIAVSAFTLGVFTLLLLLPVAVLNYVWNSCVWTLFWRRTAGASPRRATMDSTP